MRYTDSNWDIVQCQKQEFVEGIQPKPPHPLITSFVQHQDQKAALTPPKPLHSLLRGIVQCQKQEFVEGVQPESLLQRSAESVENNQVSSNIESQLRRSQGGGSPLSAESKIPKFL